MDCRQEDTFTSLDKLGLSSKSLSMSLGKSLSAISPELSLDQYTSHLRSTCLMRPQTWPNSAWRCQAG